MSLPYTADPSRRVFEVRVLQPPSGTRYNTLYCLGWTAYRPDKDDYNFSSQMFSTRRLDIQLLRLLNKGNELIPAKGDDLAREAIERAELMRDLRRGLTHR